MPRRLCSRAKKKADYAAIAGRIVGVSRPRDAIEEFLIRDVIDLTWALRLRRIKVGLLRASMDDGIERVLTAVGCFLERDTLSKAWMAGDGMARKKIDAILEKAGLTVDEVTAETLHANLDSFEQLDRMQASAEARRNNALREIDRHREATGAAVRRAIDEVEDVELRDRNGRSQWRARILTTIHQRRAHGPPRRDHVNQQEPRGRRVVQRLP